VFVISHYVFIFETQKTLMMTGNLIYKLPRKMQGRHLVLEQIALKCLPEVERGISSLVFNTIPIELKAAGRKMRQ
jgi:hypothetical protein